MQNYTQTEMAQYANSPTITTLINAINQWIDPSASIELFLTQVWNVSTATGYGLNVWGQIVGVSRTLQVPYSGSFFGFAEASGQPFGQGVFYNGTYPSSNVTLGDSDFRTLIMLKAAANISNGTVPAINAMLKALFGSAGYCFVQDTGDMTMRLVFYFTPTVNQLAILLHSGVVPRPAGVLACVVQLPAPTTFFGFAEQGGQPFGQGIYLGPTGIQNVVI